MRWIKPVLRNSLSALLGNPPASAPGAPVEAARQAMLRALGEDGARAHPRLRQRLQFSSDPQALWYARSDVMSVLSQMHGQAYAEHVVTRLTPLFHGLVPKSLLESCRLRG